MTEYVYDTRCTCRHNMYMIQDLFYIPSYLAHYLLHIMSYLTYILHIMLYIAYHVNDAERLGIVIYPMGFLRLVGS